MWAGAERELPPGLACQVECVGLGVPAGVATGAFEIEDRHLPAVQLDVAAHEVFSREASNAGRRSEPEQFGRGVAGELRAARKLAPLLLAEEMEDARRDRLRSCFEATEDEIRDERERLVMCEVVCGVVSDELRRDVVFGRDAFFAQEILEVRAELDGGALGTLTASGA